MARQPRQVLAMLATVLAAMAMMTMLLAAAPADAQGATPPVIINTRVRSNTFLYGQSNACEPSNRNTTAVEVVVTTQDGVTQHPWVQADFNGATLFVYGTAPEISKAVNISLNVACHFVNLQTLASTKSNYSIKIAHVPQDGEFGRLIFLLDLRNLPFSFLCLFVCC